MLNWGHGSPEAERVQLGHPRTPQTLRLSCTWNLSLTMQKTATGKYHQEPTTSTVASGLISTSQRRAALFLAIFSSLWIFLNPESKKTAHCGCVLVIEGEIRMLCLKISFWSFMLLWPRMSAKGLNLLPNLEMPVISDKAVQVFTRSSGFQKRGLCSGHSTMTSWCTTGAGLYAPHGMDDLIRPCGANGELYLYPFYGWRN